MYIRQLSEYLKAYANQYPCITVTGPRQSGKTTLVRHSFKDYRYVSLEDPDKRSYAISDPRGFLEDYDDKVIFDEIQRTPDLFSYIQTRVDEVGKVGQFILTGSQNFTLSHHISQSLAGRTAICRLLPFSYSELQRRDPQKCWFGHPLNKILPVQDNLLDLIFTGFYPRIYEYQLSPTQFYRDYVETYVSKDIRELLQVQDLRTFEIFLQLLAGRSAQLINLSSLANDVGITHTTIKRWLSILETSHIITIVPPFFKNYSKRLVKTPKCYFNDTGLLCYLLNIRNTDSLRQHPLIGSIFETFVINEILKTFYHASKKPPLYFYRDQSGTEIDVIIDYGTEYIAVEIKAGKTISTDYFTNIKKWLQLESGQVTAYVIYGGDEFRKQQGIQVMPWYAIS